MQQQSAALQAALAKGRQDVATLVEVIEGGAGPDDKALATLEPDAGSVSLDETRATRRSFTGLHLAISKDRLDLVPGPVGDLLHPATGNEIRIRSGRVVSGGAVTLPNGKTADMCWLGFYRFDKPAIADTGAELSITLNGLDRAQAIAQERWTDPFQVQPNATIPQAIRRILADRWPTSMPPALDATACTGHPVIDLTVPNSVFGTDQSNTNPWADMQTLAAAGACEIYFNEVGNVVLRPFIDAATAEVVATYAEGSTATITNLSREIDPTRTFSGIVVTGGNTTDKVVAKAVVWDVDPQSATYINKVGRIPAFYNSPLIRNNDQARLVGDGLLRRIKLSSEVVTFTAVPNPGHEGGDAVQLTRARAGVSGKYLLSNFSLDLSPTGSMSLTTRSTTDSPEQPVT